MGNLYIKKASGEEEIFSPGKVLRSLKNANIPEHLAEQTGKFVERKIRKGSSTFDIYNNAYGYLKKHHPASAARFSLKRAIFELGPSGFPFERFVGELFKAKGFKVKVGVMVPGVCVIHEVDVVAEKEDKHVLVECKYHNQPGIKTDVKIALYVQARFEDIAKKHKHENKFDEIYLVTNTKLTSDAIAYANCVGMKAIAWNYPEGQNLQNLILSSGLYPLTCLTTLNSYEKRQFLNNNIVLCKTLGENDELLGRVIKKGRIQKVKAEISEVCGIEYPFSQTKELNHI